MLNGEKVNHLSAVDLNWFLSALERIMLLCSQRLVVQRGIDF
jgi:hypothetical protein